MAAPIPADERDAMIRLLAHLRTCRSLKDVDERLLMAPEGDTRPGIGLVGSTPPCSQLFMGTFSIKDVVMSVAVAFQVVVVLIVAVSLRGATWLLPEHVKGWWWVVVMALDFVQVLLLVLFILRYWVQQLSWSRRRGLFLDLDELRYVSPRWRRTISWGDLYTATAAGRRRLKVEWENGAELWVWLASCCDRNLLVGIVRELIRLHHPDRHGRVDPDPSAAGVP